MLPRSLLCVLAAVTVVHCQPPAGVVTPVRDPENYTLTFRDPLGCEVDGCAYFAGIDINTGNSDYLDVYIEGDAQAWVALGFSDTANMFSADVLACNLDSGDVEVLDTWNLAEMQRDNVVDTVQDVFLFSGNFTDGRISCTFSRLISGTSDVPMQDLDLSQDYFVLYGGNPNPGQAGRLVAHPFLQDNPISISATRVNAANLTVLDVAEPGEIPSTVIAPTRAPLDYRITARTPVDCDPSSCEVFVGIDTNSDPNFLDIYLEGDAQGWVAVGFSNSANMFDADVLACDLDPTTGMVEVIDSWNEGSPARNNLRDPSPNTGDTGNFSLSFEDGRIICTFPRRILGTNIGVEDLDLNEPYFILYGQSSDSGSPGQLEPHATGSGNPFVSSSRVNPQTDTADIGSDRSIQDALTRAHGIFMIIAWPVLAVTAIFFAAWMRPALPNGEWFQVHRALMLASLFMGVVGFILIFAAQYNRPTDPGLINLGEGAETETAHFSIGIIVMALQIANPIIAIFRCHPGKPNRWIFNLIHGTVIGLIAEILALINVGIGLSLFGEGFDRFPDLTLFYVYLSWEMFLLVLIVVLFVVFTVLAATSDEEDRKKLAPSLTKALIRNPSGNQEVELAAPGQKPADPPEDQRKPPSRDAPIRWIAFVVFAAVTIPMMFALIVLVALPQ